MIFADAIVAFPDLGLSPWVNTLLLIIAGYLIKHFFPNLIPFLKPVFPNMPFPEAKVEQAVVPKGYVLLSEDQFKEVLHARTEPPVSP